MVFIVVVLQFSGGVVSASRGEWARLITFAVLSLAGAGAWLYFRGRANGSVSEFALGNAPIHGMLEFSSVPAPIDGQSLLPSLVAFAPGTAAQPVGLPVTLSLADESLFIRKKAGIASGRNELSMEIPFAGLELVAEGSPEFAVGGRMLSLGLVDGSVMKVHLPMMSERAASEVAASVDELQRPVAKDMTAKPVVDASEHRRNRRATR